VGEGIPALQRESLTLGLSVGKDKRNKQRTSMQRNATRGHIGQFGLGGLALLMGGLAIWKDADPTVVTSMVVAILIAIGDLFRSKER
jgi:hypothetical protein